MLAVQGASCSRTQSGISSNLRGRCPAYLAWRQGEAPGCNPAPAHSLGRQQRRQLPKGSGGNAADGEHSSSGSESVRAATRAAAASTVLAVREDRSRAAAASRSICVKQRRRRRQGRSRGHGRCLGSVGPATWRQLHLAEGGLARECIMALQPAGGTAAPRAWRWPQRRDEQPGMPEGIQCKSGGSERRGHSEAGKPAGRAASSRQVDWLRSVGMACSATAPRGDSSSSHGSSGTGHLRPRAEGSALQPRQWLWGHSGEGNVGGCGSAG